jgi:hypothetical protein
MFESRRRANAERELAKAAALLLALLALLMIFLGIVTTSSSLYYVAILFFVSAGLALISKAGTWSIGAYGEEIVAQHLSHLGPPYRVIHDVILPGVKGNIDHIVLGINGVFVVETKNHKGLIMCDGDSWIQRKVGQHGTPYLGKIGCPSKQVKRCAILLRNLIQDRLGMNIYVNGVVVFTNKDAIVRINNPTVIVLKPDKLCEFIMTHKSETPLREQELDKLETIIRPYSQFH